MSVKKQITRCGKFTIGMEVSFIGRGKGARLEGRAGQRCTGIIQRFEHLPEIGMCASVKITSHESLFDGTIVPVEDLRGAK